MSDSNPADPKDLKAAQQAEETAAREAEVKKQEAAANGQAEKKQGGK